MNISFIKEKGSKYIVFVLIGLLILVLCIPTEGKTVSLSQENTEIETGELETQLEGVLSAMEGVGKVKVMITTEGKRDSVFETGSQAEKVCGVVVVAEGAGNIMVHTRILEAVEALFSIDAHKISIVKMRSQEDRK